MNESIIQKLSRMITGKSGRWIVIGIWIALTAILTFTLPSVGEKEVNKTVDLPSDAPSMQADELVEKEFPNSSGVPALLTWHREGGLADEDLAAVQALNAELTKNPLPNQSFLPPIDQVPLPALKEFVSEDGTTLVQTIFFAEDAGAEELKENLNEIQAIVKKQGIGNPFKEDIDSSELSIRATGPVGISVDATGLFKGADVTLLIGTVLLVLVLLLLIYRSPLLAIIPLIGVGFAYLVTSPILGFMADKGWITVDAQSISIMTVLLFGAGTDYCLFLISHYRTELRKTENKRKALMHAFTDSSGAIAMSGLTIVISLLTLLVAEYGAYTRFAVPFSLSIFIMGIAALTLVPAILAVFGRASFFPIIPRTPEMEKERAQKTGKPVKRQKKTNKIGNKIGNLVIKKPWTVVIISVVIFGILGAYSTQVKYTYDILSSFPEDMDSREGFAVISDAYSPGELAPAKIVIDTEGKDIPLTDALKEIDIVETVSDPEEGAINKNLKAYTVKFSINPYSLEAMDNIPALKTAAESVLTDADVEKASDKVWISGQTATQHDNQVTSDKDRTIIIPLIVILIALLLLAYLRSITAMIYLMGTVILSYTAALGLGWFILHNFMGVEAIQGAIPLYAFVFLVALGEDYNIFMVSSIWKKKKSMPIKQAIKEGVSETSGVITSAGIILAATFAVLTTVPIQVLVQFGLITSIGVLMDTFIVRPFLVPAITALLGRYAFWPSKAKLYEGEKEN